MKNTVTYACFGVAAVLGVGAAWIGLSGDPAPDTAPQVVSTTASKPTVPKSKPPVSSQSTVPDIETVTDTSIVNRDNMFTETTPVPALFRVCDDAYAVGVHHIPKDSPLYRPELDRNHDGVACTDPPATLVPTVTKPVGGGLLPGDPVTVTETVTAPGTTVTETVTAPGTTVTETVPTTVTETVTVSKPPPADDTGNDVAPLGDPS